MITVRLANTGFDAQAGSAILRMIRKERNGLRQIEQLDLSGNHLWWKQEDNLCFRELKSIVRGLERLRKLNLSGSCFSFDQMSKMNEIVIEEKKIQFLTPMDWEMRPDIFFEEANIWVNKDEVVARDERELSMVTLDKRYRAMPGERNFESL